MDVARPRHLAAGLLTVAALCLLLSPRLAPAIGQARAAAATLSLSSGPNLPHGTEIVVGSGFDPLATVDISLHSSLGTNDAGLLAADAMGAFSTAITLPFTLDVGLTNVITAQQVGAMAAASVPLQGLAVMPSAGAAGQMAVHPGDAVRLHVLGFAPYDPLAVSVGGFPALLSTGVRPFVTDQTGSADLQFIVPGAAQPGIGAIIISGLAAGAGQFDSTTVPIDVAGPGTMAVSPNPARAGKQLSVAAGGFIAGEPLTLTMGYVDSTSRGTALLAASAVANQVGDLSTILVVPATAAPGTTATVEAQGLTSGILVSQALTIDGQPAIDVQPPGAGPGTAVSLFGSGFLPGERVFLSTLVLKVPSGSLVADATGRFTTTTSILPLLLPGIYSVGASGVDGNLASTQFTVPPRRTPFIHLSPRRVMPGEFVEVTGSGFQAHEQVRLSFDGTWLHPDSGDPLATAAGGFAVQVRVPASLTAAGPHALAGTGQLTGASGTSRLDITLPLVNRTYFAEGFTGDGPNVRFGESLNLLNTGPITATGQIQYFVSAGMTKTVAISVPAHARLVEDVPQDVGRNQAVSALVELDHAVAATRTITRTSIAGQILGSSVSVGETNSASFWYFAEGYTGASFQEYLSLLNPGLLPAHVMVQFFGLDGAVPTAPASVTVPPHQRATLSVRTLVPNRSVGLLVTADQAIVAERVLYWGDGSGSAKYGTSVSSGVRGTSTVWTFPFASTSGADQAFISFANPTNVDAHVQFAAAGSHRAGVAPGAVTIKAGVRVTVAVPDQGLNGSPISMVARSDVPIVAEQAQYFGGSPNTGMHMGSVVPGVTAATQWAFAGSSAGGFSSGGWYAYNPGTSDATLTGTIFGANGQQSTALRTAPAGKLTRIDSDSGQGSPAAAGVLWTSTTPVCVVHILRGANAGIAAVIIGSSGLVAGP